MCPHNILFNPPLTDQAREHLIIQINFYRHFDISRSLNTNIMAIT